VYDSSLSEEGVLGFEYGYSVIAENALVAWEAQFGDFGNGAQTIIDQYIAASEDKWKQKSRVVMLLPHGYEGQGPEHSSARLERYLQLCAENNLQVCYPTTPAQYFHLLRRQVRPGMERPLIVMTPKSLLRLPAAASTIDDLAGGGFRPLIDDAEITDAAAVKKIVLCAGKVYYDLVEARKKAPEPRVAVVRVEQFYPFPLEAIRDMLDRYKTRATWFGRRKSRRTWAAGRSCRSDSRTFCLRVSVRDTSGGVLQQAPRLGRIAFTRKSRLSSSPTLYPCPLNDSRLIISVVRSGPRSLPRSSDQQTASTPKLPPSQSAESIRSGAAVCLCVCRRRRGLRSAPK
jgi:hypothetical protein